MAKRVSRPSLPDMPLTRWRSCLCVVRSSSASSSRGLFFFLACFALLPSGRAQRDEPCASLPLPEQAPWDQLWINQIPDLFTFSVLAPPSAVQKIDYWPAGFGPMFTPASGLTAELSTEINPLTGKMPFDACKAGEQNHTGKIVLVDQSGCLFYESYPIVEAMGAAAVIYVLPEATLDGTWTAFAQLTSYSIPAVMIDWRPAKTLFALLQANETVRVHFPGTGATDPADIAALTAAARELTSIEPDATYGVMARSWATLLQDSTVGDPCLDRLHGLWCINGRVVKIECFNECGLSGPFPPSLLRLSHLKTLSFWPYANQVLSGSVPACPLFQLQDLRAFEVFGSGIDSFAMLPLDSSSTSCVTTLPNMLMLRLNNNQLTALPDWIFSSCPNLIQLLAQSNSITGLPKSFSTSVSPLQYLNLQNNQLAGNIPPFPTSLISSLKMLDLSGNKLTGTLGKEWTGCEQLEQLKLQNNQFEGALPSLVGASKLITLLLHSNSFSGAVPTSWQDLTQLQRLDLSYNFITSPIRLAALRGLIDADFSYNDFTVDQQDGLGNWLANNVPKSVQLLSFRHNKLQGLWGLGLNNWPCELRALDLSDNMLEEVPSFLFSKAFCQGKLEFINMSYNNLTGALPSDTPQPKLIKALFDHNPHFGRGIIPDYLVFDHSQQVVFSKHLLCYSLTGNQAAKKLVELRVDPFYYAYEECKCNQGSYGSAPACQLIPAQRNVTDTRLVSDADYGDDRFQQGLDTSWVIQSNTTLQTQVVVIQLGLFPAFNDYNDRLTVYAGDDAKTPVFFMRGSESPNYIVPSQYSDQGVRYVSVAGSMDAAVAADSALYIPVYSHAAVIQFQSRKNGMQHFSARATFLPDCPQHLIQYCGYEQDEFMSELQVLCAVLIAIVCAICLCATAFVLRFRDYKILRDAPKEFHYLILFAGTGLTLSLILYIVPVTSDAMCDVRYQLPFYFTVLLVAPLPSQFWSYYVSDDPRVVLDSRVLLLRVGFLLAVQVALTLACYFSAEHVGMYRKEWHGNPKATPPEPRTLWRNDCYPLGQPFLSLCFVYYLLLMLLTFFFGLSFIDRTSNLLLADSSHSQSHKESHDQAASATHRRNYWLCRFFFPRRQSSFKKPTNAVLVWYVMVRKVIVGMGFCQVLAVTVAIVLLAVGNSLHTDARNVLVVLLGLILIMSIIVSLYWYKLVYLKRAQKHLKSQGLLWNSMAVHTRGSLSDATPRLLSLDLHHTVGVFGRRRRRSRPTSKDVGDGARLSEDGPSGPRSAGPDGPSVGPDPLERLVTSHLEGAHKSSVLNLLHLRIPTPHTPWHILTPATYQQQQNLRSVPLQPYEANATPSAGEASLRTPSIETGGIFAQSPSIPSGQRVLSSPEASLGEPVYSPHSLTNKAPSPTARVVSAANTSTSPAYTSTSPAYTSTSPAYTSTSPNAASPPYLNAPDSLKVAAAIKESVNWKNILKDGTTPLMQTVQLPKNSVGAQHVSAEAVKVLLKHGANVNEGDDEGNTALHYAARDGNEQAIKVLLQCKDINPYLRNNDRLTALQLAAAQRGKRNEAASRVLIDFLRMVKAHAPVLNAVLEGAGDNKYKVVKQLVMNRADVNANLLGLHPLLEASRQDETAIALLLLTGGAAVDVSDKDGVTPLLQACKHNNLRLVKALVRAGGNLEGKTNDKQSCWDLARDKLLLEFLNEFKSITRVSRQQVTFLQKLGQGDFGAVYAGSYVGVVQAVKVPKQHKDALEAAAFTPNANPSQSKTDQRGSSSQSKTDQTGSSRKLLIPDNSTYQSGQVEAQYGDASPAPAEEQLVYSTSQDSAHNLLAGEGSVKHDVAGQRDGLWSIEEGQEEKDKAEKREGTGLSEKGKEEEKAKEAATPTNRTAPAAISEVQAEDSEDEAADMYYGQCGEEFVDIDDSEEMKQAAQAVASVYGSDNNAYGTYAQDALESLFEEKDNAYYTQDEADRESFTTPGAVGTTLAVTEQASAVGSQAKSVSVVNSYKETGLSTPVASGTSAVLSGSAYQAQLGRAYGSFLHEAIISKKIGSKPHVVPFRGADLSRANTMLVYEMMPGNCVEDLLEKEQLPLREIARMLIEASTGLWAMHSARIIHRDVAARNFLLDSHRSVYICDFGLSQELPEDKDEGYQGGGPYKWMAPEAMRPTNIFSEKTDVYMFAIFMWEMFARQRPYPGLGHSEAAKQVLEKGLRPEIPSDWSAGHAALMRRCWSKDPTDRPGMKEVCETLKALLTGLQDSGLSPQLSTPARTTWQPSEQASNSPATSLSAESSARALVEIERVQRLIQAEAKIKELTEELKRLQGLLADVGRGSSPALNLSSSPRSFLRTQSQRPEKTGASPSSASNMFTSLPRSASKRLGSSPGSSSFDSNMPTSSSSGPAALPDLTSADVESRTRSNNVESKTRTGPNMTWKEDDGSASGSPQQTVFHLGFATPASSAPPRGSAAATVSSGSTPSKLDSKPASGRNIDEQR